MFIFGKTTTTAAATLLLAFAGITTASASSDDSIAELVELNPGTSYSQMQADLSAYAEANNTTVEAVAQEALEDARGSTTNNVASSSGFRQAVPVLPAGRNRGDIFVTPANTLGFDHGHTGLYFSAEEIIEAPGKKGEHTQSHRISRNNVSAPSGSVLLNVKIDQATKDSVADWTNENLLGRPYNSNFAVNKFGSFSALNCSQLVWHAYDVAAGINLDSNGGPGVYPYNIKDSEHTEIYHTVS
ncbi:hypothetical protein ACFP6B_00570 [Rothia nasimurium]|uniref:hypothetical protein n=1 Tax=Rothia nasimurium TaxID=85336 RepID=UPI00361E46ED